MCVVRPGLSYFGRLDRQEKLRAGYSKLQLLQINR